MLVADYLLSRSGTRAAFARQLRLCRRLRDRLDAEGSETRASRRAIGGGGHAAWRGSGPALHFVCRERTCRARFLRYRAHAARRALGIYALLTSHAYCL